MSADNFETCLSFVLKYEGGYVNNPRDPGGPTNRGITIATLSHELGRAATVADVRALTRELAATIYRKKYWNLIGGDMLPRGLDLLAFDIAVNSGPGRALEWLRATGSMPTYLRIAELDAKRRSFWRSLKTWAVFGKGWSAREDACFALATVMRKVSP